MWKLLGEGKAGIRGRTDSNALWEDKDGIKRFTTEIIASNMQMLDSKGQGKSTDDLPADNSAAGTDIPTDDVPF